MKRAIERERERGRERESYVSKFVVEFGLVAGAGEAALFELYFQVGHLELADVDDLVVDAYANGHLG